MFAKTVSLMFPNRPLYECKQRPVQSIEPYVKRLAACGPLPTKAKLDTVRCSWENHAHQILHSWVPEQCMSGQLFDEDLRRTATKASRCRATRYRAPFGIRLRRERPEDLCDLMLLFTARRSVTRKNAGNPRGKTEIDRNESSVAVTIRSAGTGAMPGAMPVLSR